MTKEISKEIAEKLSSFRGQQKKFEEILEGVQTYPAEDVETFGFILNGLAMRLQVDLTRDRLGNFYEYAYNIAGQRGDLWRVVLNSLKLLWRAPDAEVAYRIKDLSLRFALEKECSPWVKICRGISDYTDLLSNNHKDFL